MMDVQSIEQIYTSWDHVKSFPNYQEEFGVTVFSGIRALSKRVGSLFFLKDGKADRTHAKLFTQMMDLIIHMLGPDMDEVLEQLEDLGERHAESYGVTSKMYPIFGEALLNTLELLLGEIKFDNSTRESWLSLWRIMSMTMLKGGRRVIKRRRKEKHEQRVLEWDKQQQHESSSLLEVSPDLTESSSSFSTTDLPKPSSSRKKGPSSSLSSSFSTRSPSKRNNSCTMVLMNDGDGSSSAYLSYSDEEDLFSSPNCGRARRNRGLRKKQLLHHGGSDDGNDDDDDDDEPRRPSSLSDMTAFEIDEEDEDDELPPSKKPSSFTMGRIKKNTTEQQQNKIPARGGRPSFARAQSCRLSSTSTSSDQRKGPGMMKKMSSFRFRKQRGQLLDF